MALAININDLLTIQNVGGPDGSISAADISKCEILVS